MIGIGNERRFAHIQAVGFIVALTACGTGTGQVLTVPFYGPSEPPTGPGAKNPTGQNPDNQPSLAESANPDAGPVEGFPGRGGTLGSVMPPNEDAGSGCPTGFCESDDSGSPPFDSGSGTGNGTTPAAFVASCSGTYTCTGALGTSATFAIQGGQCTATVEGVTGVLGSDGTITVEGMSVGTWSVSSSGVYTGTVTGEGTDTCSP